MNITMELAIIIIAQLITIGIFIGKLNGFQKIVEFRLNHLEKKQDRHNSLVERVAIVENTSSAAHRRLDDLTKRG